MDPLRLLELEMRDRAGLLAGPERGELAAVPITIGKPPAIVLPRPCKSEDEFEARVLAHERRASAWMNWNPRPGDTFDPSPQTENPA